MEGRKVIYSENFFCNKYIWKFEVWLGNKLSNGVMKNINYYNQHIVYNFRNLKFWEYFVKIQFCLKLKPSKMKSIER